MTHHRLRYQIDSGDRIRFVDSSWLDFARKNGAAELAEPLVLNRPLWQFIAGKETQHLYGLIFDAVRDKQKTATIPFRCDSPECRRYMELSIAPLPNDGLEIAASLIREEPRPYVRLLDPNIPRGGELVTICGWCKKVLVPDEDWVEVETAVRCLNLFSAEALPQITHGICGGCQSAVDLQL